VKSTIKTDSAFKAIQNGVNSMLSSGGSITVGESTGNLTVTDTPQVLNRVGEYIKTQNAIASKQVAIKTEIYEISSDENGDFEPDLAALYNFGDVKLGFSGSTLSFSQGDNDAATNHKFSDDSKASLKLLRTNKNVTQVTSSTIYAMNGEPTPFQQLDEVGYLAEVQIETAASSGTGGSGTNSNVATLKPGKTSQGFSMTLIPRINSEGRVQMKFAVDSSRLNSIDSYGLTGGAQIQVPNRSTNKYNQLVTVKSGQPLMIAGLEQTANNATITSPFGRKSWLLGGSQTGGKKKVMTMIVLTPYILQK
jgi:type IVB pilus formation R64 PilN family outer membrane protein